MEGGKNEINVVPSLTNKITITQNDFTNDIHEIINNNNHINVCSLLSSSNGDIRSLSNENIRSFSNGDIRTHSNGAIRTHSNGDIRSHDIEIYSPKLTKVETDNNNDVNITRTSSKPPLPPSATSLSPASSQAELIDSFSVSPSKRQRYRSGSKTKTHKVSFDHEKRSLSKRRSMSDSNESIKEATTLEQLRNELDEIKMKLEERNDTHVVEKPPYLTPQQRANKNRVVINIGGIRHETYRSTLKNIPDTRLSWIAEESAIHSPEYDPITGEFFFDRHPQVFSHILNYYRTGNLHVPYDVCGPLFEDELQYWGIDDTQVESCCWLSYRQHRDAQETLKEFEGIEFEKDYDDESEPDLSKYGFNIEENEEGNEVLTWYQKWQPYMWRLMEDPYSSTKAKIVALTSMFLIMLSVVLFCLETMSYFNVENHPALPLTILEGVCTLFFSIELGVRLAFCPHKMMFIKGVMNWIDFLAIIPFFVTVVMKYAFNSDSNYNFLQVVRVIRVFRIIKLSKHSIGLQILGHTLKASFRELLLLIFFLIIGIVIFSSLVYYCEHTREPDTKFVDIPTTFWWAVITMTTVGYGDMVPFTPLGKLIGGLCSVSGVLMIALPVPVIVNNFNLYYSHAQARLKLPKKKRRMLCGAANALKGPVIEEEFDEADEEVDEGSSDESLPSVNVKKPSVTANGSADEEQVGDENDNHLAVLRLKKFARRDSNMFGASQNHTKNNNGDDKPTPQKSSYALHKRRSLLPVMNSLPENDD